MNSTADRQITELRNRLAYVEEQAKLWESPKIVDMYNKAAEVLRAKIQRATAAAAVGNARPCNQH